MIEFVMPKMSWEKPIDEQLLEWARAKKLFIESQKARFTGKEDKGFLKGMETVLDEMAEKILINHELNKKSSHAKEIGEHEKS